MTQQPHLAFFMPVIQVGGVECTLLNILCEMKKREYTVTLLTSGLTSEFESQLPPSVNVKFIGSNSLMAFILKPFSLKVSTSISAMLDLVRFFRSNESDAMYSFQGSTVAVLARIISGSKKPLFVRESNTPSQSFIFDGAISKRLKLFLKKILYSKSNAVIAVSKGVADDLVESVKIPRSKVKVIYNPTYTPRLIEQSKESVEHKWFQPNPSTPVVISIGRLSRQKDFLTLIEAFALVRQKQEARLLIIGDGPEHSKIECRANALGIADDVDLIGELSNPYKYLIRADVFVLSSIFEGLPNVMIEAVGCGTPIVATDCPSGPREILLDGEAGTLVPINNPKQMAEATLDYLNDSALADRHVNAGFNALHRFTSERATDAYVDLVAKANR